MQPDPPRGSAGAAAAAARQNQGTRNNATSSKPDAARGTIRQRQQKTENKQLTAQNFPAAAAPTSAPAWQDPGPTKITLVFQSSEPGENSPLFSVPAQPALRRGGDNNQAVSQTECEIASLHQILQRTEIHVSVGEDALHLFLF